MILCHVVGEAFEEGFYRCAQILVCRKYGLVALLCKLNPQVGQLFVCEYTFNVDVVVVGGNLNDTRGCFWFRGEHVLLFGGRSRWRKGFFVEGFDGNIPVAILAVPCFVVEHGSKHIVFGACAQHLKRFPIPRKVHVVFVCLNNLVLIIGDGRHAVELKYAFGAAALIVIIVAVVVFVDYLGQIGPVFAIGNLV